MSVARTDRPAPSRSSPPPSSTSSTSSTSSPSSTSSTSSTDEMSSIDGPDDAERLDEAEGQSVVDGFSAAPPPKPVVSPSIRRIDGPAPLAPTVNPADVDAVTAVVNATIGKLAPGESATVGAKLEGAVEIAVGAEVGFEIKRRDDGKYEVKLEQTAFVGGGGQMGYGKAEVKSVAGIEGKIAGTFVVDTPMEAAKIVASSAAVAAAASGVVGPVNSSVVAGAVATAVFHDKMSEVSVSLGIAVEVGATFGAVAQLEAAIEGSGAVGIVYAPPEAFLEVTGEGTFGAELGLKVDEKRDSSVSGPDAGVEGTLKVRIPLGRVGSLEELLDPAKQKALVDAAAAKQPAATMSFEGKLGAASVAGGVSLNVEKEVVGNRLDDLWADGGWKTQLKSTFGDKLGGGLGPLSAEVGLSYDLSLYRTTSTSPAEAQAEIAAHLDEIKRKQKRLEKENGGVP